MDSIGRVLIGVGIALVLLGGALVLGAHWGVPLGRLPGDLRIERPGFRLYLPITTCLLVSGALSLLSWLISKLFPR
jgi:hypothetical protein